MASKPAQIHTKSQVYYWCAKNLDISLNTVKSHSIPFCHYVTIKSCQKLQMGPKIGSNILVSGT